MELVVQPGERGAQGGNSLKRKMRLAALTDRIDVVPAEVAIFRIRPQEGEVFPFRAGQYATLGLDVGGAFVARAYSITSSPYTRDHLELYINVIAEGQLTPALFRLQVGEGIYYMGPKGIFTLERAKRNHLLLVATGTGLAPYISMMRKLRDELRDGRPQDKAITLIHGVRHSEDLGYRQELEALALEEELNFVYIPMVSRTSEDPLWTPDLGKGRVTDILRLIGEECTYEDISAFPNYLDPKTVLMRLPPDNTAMYLCGNPEMTHEAKRILREKGCREVYTEDYW